jgi:flagellar protein FliJ
MRFAYPLQKIVDLKANEKKQAESVLSQAIAKLTEEERMRDELISSKRSFQEHIVGQTANSLPISQLMLVQQYIDHLDEQLQRSEKKIVLAQEHVEQRREHLKDRMIDQKVWDKAREKAYTAHVAQVEKESQKTLDDLAITRRRNA